MNLRGTVRFICFALIFWSLPSPAAGEDFTNAIRAFLQQRVGVAMRDVGIVVGIVDEHGSSSVTKTFTALLLQDMMERGEVNLNDQVAKYLPKPAKMPTRNGKEITLLQLATHTSGLPCDPENLASKHAGNPFADYTVEKLYAFLSGYKLTRDPGTKNEYSNLGIGLLGHVIALKAGTNYESLVVERICRPSKMDSTRITLPPELKARFARGHDRAGHAAPSFDCELQNPLVGAGALRSTANDMLKYVSANLGLTPSSLTPLMEKTHARYLHQTAEVDMGLPTDHSADAIDSDGDGMNRRQAWIAGTDPTNPSSVLSLSPSNNASGITVSWQSSAGKTYYLQRGTNLSLQPTFSSIQSNIVGQAVTTTFVDTSTTGAGPYFYRVGVQQ